VLLVANHPNAFMDALLIAAFSKRPIHFLARGDAFNNPILAAIFRTFNMLPVYRISEGKENIGKNTETFEASQELLSKQGIVLIFGEGWCVQNWDLRPLKKGSARIAERAWNTPASQNMVIVPVGLTYEHFTGSGKSVVIKFGLPIDRFMNSTDESGASFVRWLNTILTEQLKTLAYINPELEYGSYAHQQFTHNWRLAERNRNDILTSIQLTKSDLPLRQSLTELPGLNGNVWMIPHYVLMKTVAKLLTSGTVFYDSVLFLLTILLLPFYVATIICIAFVVLL
jgi:hypothetical protein